MSLIYDPMVDIAICHYIDKLNMYSSHIHPQYELYFCPEDIEQLSIVNGVEYRYKYPCVIISSPYTIHSMSYLDDRTENWERFVMYYSKSVADHLTDRYLNNNLCANNSGYLFKITAEQAQSLKNMIIASSPETAIENELLLAMFLNKLLGYCPFEKAIKVGTSSFYIQDVLQYVAETLQDQPTADDIAYKFSVSRSKLDRDFKRFTGGTLHDFVDNCRLNQSKSLLRSRLDLSIADVAKSSGFINEAYFFSYFKKHTGRTPAEYRKAKSTAN